MIARVWLRIALVLVAAVVPLFLIELRLQGEALRLALRWVGSGSAAAVVDAHLMTLKQLARLAPDEAPRLKKQFAEALEHKRDIEDLGALGVTLVSDLERQSVLYALAVLALSLLGALWLSTSIVQRFRGLIAEKERAAAKVAKLESLESWQETARMLVHELRGPMTPISLIASDLETQYREQPPAAFAGYLTEGATILRQQAQALSDMIATFTAFGQLPAAKPRSTELAGFLEQFLRVHGSQFEAAARLSLDVESVRGREIGLDPQLAQNLLVNLVRNACEANPGETIDVRVTATCADGKALLRVQNSGKLIPAQVAPRIFEPRVSTKAATQKGNVGLGLAIAKKIALDHGGDLVLAYNDASHGVVFELELPA